MENKVYLGSTDIDWNGIFTGVTTLAASYLGYRATVRAGERSAQGGGGQTVVYQPAPSGGSSMTRTLLIGGGLIAAGLLVYSLTKKKDGK